MTSSRQLAAIMFTDIVGYTALMGRDEAKAFEVLRKYRDNHKMLIKQFQGTWIKELGDGVLASFQTVTNAVFCAAALHEACRGNADLILRIGIHVGEVIFENNDVFGDGVNIASRLQALAAPGSTWVSEPVYKNLINKKEITSEFIKEELLKNVSEPVKVYEITVKEIPGYLPSTIKAYQAPFKVKNTLNKHSVYWILGLLLIGIAGAYFIFKPNQSTPVPVDNNTIRKSIAVLPFADISPQQDQGYFVDGMMIELLDHLVKIKDLQVRPRSSAQAFKNSTKTLTEIAGELNVENIIEGHIRNAGEQVKISVGLYNAQLNKYLWQHTYEDDISNITRVFIIQSDVAQNIAAQLNSVINPTVKKRIEQFPTTNRMAYDFFLRGKDEFQSYWSKGDTNKIKSSIEYYNQAITLDADFSEAYTGLGESYWLSGWYIRGSDPWVKSTQALQKAIALDPDNGWAYSELAVVQSGWQRDSAAAYKSLQKAAALEPGNSEVYVDLFWLHAKTQNCSGMHKILEFTSTPNQHLNFTWEVFTKICGDDTSGLQKMSLPTTFHAQSLWAALERYHVLNQSSAAVNLINQQEGTLIDREFALFHQAHTLAVAGDYAKVKQTLKLLEALALKQYVRPTYMAIIYLGIEEMDQALFYLERALKERDQTLLILDLFAAYRQKKHDPRIQALVSQRWIPLIDDENL